MKNNRSNIAVAEVLGAVLILGIATCVLSAVHYYVISAPTPNPPPIVDISSSVKENQILLMHKGGQPLSLNTEIRLNLGEGSRVVKVSDFLDDKSKADGEWNLGEELIYPIDYDFDYEVFPKADIVLVDKGSQSVVMMDSVEIDPVCDIDIDITVDNQFPGLETNVVINITATNMGNINASGIQIKFVIPDKLFYYDNMTTQGNYSHSSGIWNVGKLTPGQSVSLYIEVIVGDRGSLEDTQLLLLLDGSGSIAASDWTLQVEGLAAAVEDNETFPDDGSVELTVIQFGGGNNGDAYNPPVPGYAKVEIGPVVVTESNKAFIVDSIRKIPQINGMTPTACGIYLGADTIVKSSMFDSDIRQIIMMVTDGNPTQGCDCDGDYSADDFYSGWYKYSSEVARDYLVKTLNMSIDQDEFDAIAVGQSASHASWLKNNIVWPEPGYYAPPFLIGIPHRGWVRNVSSWQEFAESINEAFGVIFNQIVSKTEIYFTSFTDPKEANNFDDIVIIPTSSPVVITKDATNVDDSNATLNMYYNFKWIGSGQVRFAYNLYNNKSIDDWLYTPWVSKSGYGSYSDQITGLSPSSDFIFKAQLQYVSTTSGVTIVNVQAKTLTTLEAAMI